MLNPIQTIIAFVFDHIEDETIARRIVLYRALAEVAVTKAESANYLRIADALVAIEAQHHQLVLDFQQRNAK